MAAPPRRHVVTGAGSGIGAALAGRLAADGHEVLGLDRAVDTVPAGVRPIHCDLTDPASVAAAAAAVGPGVDGLAAVAGVPGTAPAATVLEVNLIGLRRLTEAVVPAMTGGGSIVLVSSMAGYRGPADEAETRELLALPDDELRARVAAAGHDGPTAYQLSKQLVHRYAVELSARLHPRGIRCSSLSPGPVQTPILADFRATMPSLDVAGDLVGRHARAEEIAAVAAFLLSPDASWVNGVDLRLDGGLGALRAVQADAAIM
jgi:NAD(P)-dependent dehydrogenase (short-subunit alcohol dehydrogenase family)